MAHTALFDAGWDVNAAFDILMDSTDHLDTWQEAGKKKKQSKSSEPKESDKEQNVSENEKKNSSEPIV